METKLIGYCRYDDILNSLSLTFDSIFLSGNNGDGKLYILYIIYCILNVCHLVISGTTCLCSYVQTKINVKVNFDN